MQTLPYIGAGILVGVLVSAQPALNALLAKSVGNPNGAAVISIAVALLSIIVIAFFTGVGQISASTLATVPWWVFMAGVVGAIFVAAGPVIAPVTGALVFFVCIVAGQLIGSALADHFGAFGLEVRQISPMRFLGILLVLSGAFIVSRW